MIIDFQDGPAVSTVRLDLGFPKERVQVNTLDHETLQQRLASADIETDGSELHGMLCGLVCSGEQEVEAVWLGEIFPETTDQLDLLVQECQGELGRLCEETRSGLEGGSLEFDLLLPDDDRPLAERAASVARWCQGFLYGIGLSGRPVDRHLSEDTGEALSDISEISRMDPARAEGDEADEAALTEVIEFLRVAAMLVREEMAQEGVEER